ENNEAHLGIKLDQRVLPVALTDHTANIDLPKTIQEVIDQGISGTILLKELIKNSTDNDYLTTEINYAPAITHPKKIICVGLNYQKHAGELKADYPKQPILSNKFNNALSAHQQTGTIPEMTERLDYEAELGV